MVDQGLTFLRYGGTMINIPGYRFKKMIGDRDKLPYHPDTVPLVDQRLRHRGFPAILREGGLHGGLCVISKTPQDMADMIEYLNGPVTSEGAPACRERPPRSLTA